MENNSFANETPTNSDASSSRYNEISSKKGTHIINMHIRQPIPLGEVSTMLGIKYKTAWTIINHLKRKIKFLRLKKGGFAIKVLTRPILDQIESHVEINPEFTLVDIKVKLELTNSGFITSITSIARGLEKLLIGTKRPHLEVFRVNRPSDIDLRKVYTL